MFLNELWSEDEDQPISLYPFKKRGIPPFLINRQTDFRYHCKPLHRRHWKGIDDMEFRHNVCRKLREKKASNKCRSL
jgi:hypothetical protein